jgi:hypothetical protein
MTIEYVRKLSAYDLARLADCASPDSQYSHGATFLLAVRNAFVEAWENGYSWELVAREAPNVYTHQMWCEFVDLAAYQEDLTDYGFLEDLETGARLALSQIAERLLYRLQEVAEEDEDEE